ncbi:hypothetical protein THOM_0531 [Trachipleistophora hominis]|uniref:Uncharacterized protein n=1 Tax=Trachipleistophora hominis TaxID=72359 RepID=L7JYG0_TRAHO|nr:hypothetical protein THOM_0531 [Trachipleistophora hominis]
MVRMFLPNVLLLPIYMLCLISVMFVSKRTFEFFFEVFSLQNKLIQSTYDPKAMIYIVEGNTNRKKVSDHLGKIEFIDVENKNFIPNGNFNITARIGYNFVFLYEDEMSMMPTKTIFLKQAFDRRMGFAELIEFIENNQDNDSIDDVKSLNTMLFLALYGYMSHFSLSVFENAIMGYVNHDIYFVIRINSPLQKFGKTENGEVSYPFIAKLVRATILAKNKNKTYSIQLSKKDLNIKNFLFFYIQKRNKIAEKIYEDIVRNKICFGLPEVQVDCIDKWKNMDYDLEMISKRSKIRFIE